MKAFHSVLFATLTLAIAAPLAGQSLAERVVHNDTSKYTVNPSVHAGAGPMNYGRLVNSPGSPETNLWFVSRGWIEPGGGIGHHFHNRCEEMFIVLDGEAEFTINGRTSVLKGPAGAPNVAGSSHAVYNPSDKRVEWMNINVTLDRGQYDTFDLQDSRKDAVLDPIAPFMTMKLDRALLRPVEANYGGKGTIQYRRALGPSVFQSPWSYVDHVVIPPGASIGGHRHVALGEWHYVMSGQGTLTVVGAAGGRRSAGGQRESAPIVKGDGVEIRIGETHEIQNTGSEPLELMVVGVARDMRKNLETETVSLAPTGR